MDLSENQMVEAGIPSTQAKRIVLALRRSGYETADDVRRVTDEQLREIINFGPTSVQRCRQVWGRYIGERGPELVKIREGMRVRRFILGGPTDPTVR